MGWREGRREGGGGGERDRKCEEDAEAVGETWTGCIV